MSDDLQDRLQTQHKLSIMLLRFGGWAAVFALLAVLIAALIPGVSVLGAWVFLILGVVLSYSLRNLRGGARSVVIVLAGLLLIVLLFVQRQHSMNASWHISPPSVESGWQRVADAGHRDWLLYFRAGQWWAYPSLDPSLGCALTPTLRESEPALLSCRTHWYRFDGVSSDPAQAHLPVYPLTLRAGQLWRE